MKLTLNLINEPQVGIIFTDFVTRSHLIMSFRRGENQNNPAP